MKLKIKQVTGAENLEVEVEASATIADLKQQVAEKLGGDATAEGLRLIYRGQILKDPLTVESYGGCWPCSRIPRDRGLQRCWLLLHGVW
jgi:hypothetical protein